MSQILSTHVQNPERFTHSPGLYTENGGAPSGELSTRSFTTVEIGGIDLKFIFNVCFMVSGGCFAVYALPQTGGAVMLDAFSVRLVLVAAVAGTLGGFLSLVAIIYMTTFPQRRNTRDAIFCVGGWFVSVCMLVAVGSMVVFSGWIAWKR